MLCESCLQNEATSHLCTILDGTSQSRALCGECSEAISPGAKDFATAHREAVCEYCGCRPCAGGTDILAMLMGVQKSKFMCVPCSTEFSRFIPKEFQRQASGRRQDEQLVLHEQMALLRTVNEATEKHMKQWISERGPK
jgi:protein-arginine kinase activator protein McsA